MLAPRLFEIGDDGVAAGGAVGRQRLPLGGTGGQSPWADGWQSPLF